MEMKSIPSIRLGQQDDSTSSMLEKGVNLYRGTVIYDQALCTLSGREEGDGLEVKLSAHYEGGERRYATERNADLPTGILGLGWTFKTSYIKLDKKTSYPLERRQYVLSFQGTSSRLVKQENELLFIIPVSSCTESIEGTCIPASVREQFRSHGISLSRKAHFLDRGERRIQDREREQEFLIQKHKDSLYVYAGGESYQCEDYKFWRILYYPQYERWSLTRENGLEVSFGGNISKTEHQFCTSEGNSVSWAVAWSDDEGKPCWTGESIESQGQVQYALEWHISRAYSRFGEYVSFSYNDFGRNDQGLINSVEQLVSPAGLPYTKACYLTGISDVYGRQIHLCYLDKQWSDASLLSNREYCDPHKPFPDTEPNGYQDCYETKYLDQVDILAPDDGSLLYRFHFAYEIEPDKGDFCKRFWTGYTIEMADGEILAGHQFEYCRDTSDNGLCGSLVRIIRPEGGSVSYHYQMAELDSCDRTLSLPLPKEVLSDAAKPGVWFGPDYGAVLWSDSHTGRLSLQIASWDGKWRIWQPQTDSPLLCEIPGGVDDSTIKVLAQNDFAAVFYETATTMRMHLFRKDSRRPCCWSEEKSSESGMDWYDQWKLADGQVQCGAGDKFLIVQQYDRDRGTGYRWIYTWNWRQGLWKKEQMPLKAVSVFQTYKTEYLSVDGRGGICHGILTADLSWVIQEAEPLDIWEDDPSQLAIALGGTMAAVVHNRSGSEKAIRYDLFLLRWNQGGKLIEMDVYQNQQDWNMNDSWKPILIEDSMAAVAGNLFFFDGRTWTRQDLTFPQSPDEGTIRYAYGKDYAVAVRAKPGNPQALFTSYHPQEKCFKNPVLLDLPLPKTHQNTSFEPTAGKDCLTIGAGLYIRPSGGFWEDVMNTTGRIDLDLLVRKRFGSDFQVNTAALCNESPDYLVCSLYGLEGGSADPSSYVAAFLLRNGGIYGQPQILDGEKIFTFQQEKAGRGGCYPFGNHMFTSYPQIFSTLDDSDTIILHQYVAEGITGSVRDWPLNRIEADNRDGIKNTTVYQQDIHTASFSKGAHFVKYCRTIYYPGGTPENQPGGSVEKQFLTTASLDVIPDVEYYHSMDGLLLRSIFRDSTGKTIISTENNWKSYTHRSLSPKDPYMGYRRIYGSYVLLQEKIDTRDGIAQKILYFYAPQGMQYTFHGQVTQTLQEIMNVSGELEEHNARTTYACEVYPHTGNDLTSVASTQKRINGQVISAQATTYKLADEIASESPCSFMPEADFTLLHGEPDFPFAVYQAGSCPDGWLCISRVLSYHCTGQVAALETANKQPSETHFSARYALPAATFMGAGKDEVLWNSFLSYDPCPGWIEHAERIADAQFGDCSLLLKAGDYVQSPKLSAVTRTEYIAELVYRTQEQEMYLDAALQISFGHVTTETSLEASPGQWKNWRLPLSDISGPVSLRIICRSGSVQLDRAALFPAGIQIEASCEDPHFLRPLTFMDTGSRVLRYVYDNCMSQIGTISPDGSLQDLSVTTKGSCLITKHKLHGHEAALTFAGGGFLSGVGYWMGWERKWQVTGDGWEIKDGLLQTPDIGTAAWSPTNSRSDRAAAYLETASLSENRKSMTCRFGANERIIWEKGRGWQWIKADGTVRQMPLSDIGDSPGNRSLLVLGQGLALFYVDGFLLFSQSDPAFVISRITWEFQGTVAVYCLAMGFDPQMQAVYSNGDGEACQMHELCDNYGIIQAWVYDSLGRIAALTRQAPCDGVGSAPMAWDPQFADIRQFMDNYQHNPVMNGNVSDYYSGDEGRSDDEGYPYKGVRYVSLREKRVSEIGLPGKKRALRPICGKSPEPGGSTQKVYRAADRTSGLPHELYAEKTTYPDGYQGIQYYDSLRRPAAAEQRGQDGRCSSFSTICFIPGNEPGIDVVTKLPLYYETEDTRYIREQKISALEDLAVWADCDGGKTEYIYDAFHKLRFSRASSDEGCFLYQKYDTQSRMIEEGTLHEIWDTAVLQERAFEMTYPTLEQGAKPRRIYTYGNEGDNIGKLIRVTTLNPVPDTCPDSDSITVTENWDYNGIGKISHASMTIQCDGQETFSTSVSYQYNHLGDVTMLQYPDGSAIPEVSFSYNSMGEMIGIGTPQSPCSIASYCWSASSQLNETNRGGLRELWVRDSAENILSHQAFGPLGEQVFSQNFSYSPGSLVTERATLPAGGDADAFFHETFTYDSMARMCRQEREGELKCYEYDVHGNLHVLQSDKGKWRFEIESGSNRLLHAIDPKETEMSFDYDKGGRPKKWKTTALTYDPGLRCVSSLKNEGALPLRFIYGANNRVVMRCQGKSVTVIFTGSGSVPLTRWDNGKMQNFIWGPTGLAAVSGETLRYPICDHLGTTWGVADPEGAITAWFDYSPFGEPISHGGEDAADWPCLFQGKEYFKEFGLYDFEARLYDPVLMRFLTPDPSRQFSSAYLFAGNNPLFLVDPSGKSSFWTTFGMIAVSVLTIAAGVALTLISGGLITPVAATAATTTAVGAGNTAAAGTMASGIFLGAVKIAKGVLLGALGGGLTTAGISGMSYSFTTKPDYERNWEDFGICYYAGISGGIVSGTLSSIAVTMISFIPVTQGIYAAVFGSMAIQFVTSPAGSVLSKMVSNTILEQDLMMGTLSRSVTGMLTGLLSGTYSGLTKCCDIQLPENASRIQNSIKNTGVWVAGIKDKAVKFAGSHKAPVAGIAVLAYGAVCFGSTYISEEMNEHALTYST